MATARVLLDGGIMHSHIRILVFVIPIVVMAAALPDGYTPRMLNPMTHVAMGVSCV